MKQLCQSTVAFVVLMTFIGCGGGGSTSQSMGSSDAFEAMASEVTKAEPMNGTTVVAVGGGSVEGLFNPYEPILAEATFSFFAGTHKNGDYKGNFVLKRVFTGDGVRGVKSTEITFVEVGEDDTGRWVIMEGIADLMATWTSNRPPGHLFRLQAWDGNDGFDMIWFEVRRPDDSIRPALTLVGITELKGGNIMIR